MDYLQYENEIKEFIENEDLSFKPCYKWITFNTASIEAKRLVKDSFKPCYKWITFNTKRD